MATLVAFLSRFRRAYEQPEAPDPSYFTLIGHGADARSYPLASEQVECAEKVAAELDRLSSDIEECRLEINSPRPEPGLRVRPQF
jgi:hypothetical protein